MWVQQGQVIIIESVPHALCRLVLIIAVELRCAQHGLGEDGQEAQGLHEQRRVQEEVGDVGRHQREGKHALQVVHEMSPRPEVAPVKVCRCTTWGNHKWVHRNECFFNN